MAEQLVAKIVTDVAFDWAGFTDQLTYDHDLGFLTLREAENLPSDQFGTHIVGFGKTLPTDVPTRYQQGRWRQTGLVTPVVDFAMLSPQDQTIDKQGKGVGPRLYNTPLGLRGTAEDPKHITAYSFWLSRDVILDLTSPSDTTIVGKARRIATHGQRIVRSRFQGVDAIVADIHAQQTAMQPHEALLYSQPPRAAVRARMRGVASSPVPDRFMIIRSAGVKLRPEGTYSPRG